MTMRLCALWLVLIASAVSSAPVAEEDQLPIDLRRTTLIVRDIDASLAFYRDALGMKVIYDQGDEPFSTGSIVLLFNTKDLESTFARVRQVRGTRVLYEPGRREYPSYDGKGVIPVMVSVLTDPDGFVIELNQLLTDKL